MVDLAKIGKAIESLRKEKNMTQDELASKLYVSRQAVSKWETGKSIPSIEAMILLTDLFNISIESLLEDTDLLIKDLDKQLIQLPREAVFSNLIKSDQLDKDFKSYFYLFTIEERKQFINLVIQGKITLPYTLMWPHLSEDERVYLLGYIITYDKLQIDELYPYLTVEERRMVSHKNHIYIRKE
jgi:transcriptional regulator with XRE-family HTH domain